MQRYISLLLPTARQIWSPFQGNRGHVDWNLQQKSYISDYPCVRCTICDTPQDPFALVCFPAVFCVDKKCLKRKRQFGSICHVRFFKTPASRALSLGELDGNRLNNKTSWWKRRVVFKSIAWVFMDAKAEGLIYKTYCRDVLAEESFESEHRT